MTTRKELVEALRVRYSGGAFGDRIKILDEFVALTGYHRKHAIRVLGEEIAAAKMVRTRNRLYDEAVRQSLTVLWEAADRICGKRMKALIPMLVDAMERHGHLDLHPVVKTKVLQVSAATIDRVLEAARLHIDGQRKRRNGVGSAIRRSIPVRTFADWRDPPPGFFEIDMVEHCGGVKTEGEFVHTLTMTDIASGWTECVAMRVRDQMLIIQAFEDVAAELPFTMLGVDSDNDSAFMSQSVFDYCKGHGLEQTRSRAYKKNDQAWVEQKNGAVVRRMVGYRRFEGLQAAAELAHFYAAMRLFVNFFQPSFKLADKQRDGARIRKRYHRPATPHQRLLADPQTPDEVRRRVNAMAQDLDPVGLLRDIRAAQQRLVDIADRPIERETVISAPTLEQFLAGLRTAWKEGEARPTARKKPAVKRLRRPPDLFATVSAQLRAWLEAEPERTDRELFERLQAQHPGVYPDGQLRTCQRRLKIWRREMAHKLVFGAESAGEPALEVEGQ